MIVKGILLVTAFLIFLLIIAVFKVSLTSIGDNAHQLRSTKDKGYGSKLSRIIAKALLMQDAKASFVMTDFISKESDKFKEVFKKRNAKQPLVPISKKYYHDIDERDKLMFVIKLLIEHSENIVQFLNDVTETLETVGINDILIDLVNEIKYSSEDREPNSKSSNKPNVYPKSKQKNNKLKRAMKDVLEIFQNATQKLSDRLYTVD